MVERSDTSDSTVDILESSANRDMSVNYLPSINSARYTQRIIQTVKSREADIFLRPDKFSHYNGIE